MIETKHERLISGGKRVVFQNKVMMFVYSLKLSAEQVTPVHTRIVAQFQTNFVLLLSQRIYGLMGDTYLSSIHAPWFVWGRQQPCNGLKHHI